MRIQWVLVGLVSLTASAYAKPPQHNRTGVLLRMDSVLCGTS
jgi:hypothetical protein